jgi:hypothetical protein
MLIYRHLCIRVYKCLFINIKIYIIILGRKHRPEVLKKERSLRGGVSALTFFEDNEEETHPWCTDKPCALLILGMCGDDDERHDNDDIYNDDEDEEDDDDNDNSDDDTHDHHPRGYAHAPPATPTGQGEEGDSGGECSGRRAESG